MFLTPDVPGLVLIALVLIPKKLDTPTGFSVTWLTGMGPMSFALVKAFNTKDYDEEEAFQFELGKTF